MAWTNPATISALPFTSLWGNGTVRDDLRYLKGLDGPVTIEAAMTIAGTVQNGVIKAMQVTLANGARQSLGAASTTSAFVIVQVKNSAAMAWYLIINTGSPLSVEVLDPTASFTNVSTSGTYRIYYEPSPSGGAYYLQNNSGGSKDFGILMVGVVP